MGSFLGHVDEAVFFMALGVWWMCMKFPRYIKNPELYRGLLSYPLPCCRRVPLEIIFKIIFPVCGLIGELANGIGPHFVDANGNFQKLNGIQHVTIYGMFALHGIFDLLTFYGVNAIPPGSNYLTVALCFLWYGISFRWHATMPGKPALETAVHLMPTYVMFLVAAVSILELWKGGRFSLNLVRIWSLLMLGTWFFHTSFIMYTPWGGEANPEWDRRDERNVHFAIAMFGAHCSLHLVVMAIFYAVCYVITPKRHLANGHGMTKRATTIDYEYSSLDESIALTNEE